MASQAYGKAACARPSAYPSRPPPSVSTIARHASRPVALTNFHKSATAYAFTLTPGNLDVEVAHQLIAFNATQMQQSADPLEDPNGWAATPTPRARSRFCYPQITLAG